MSNFVVFYLFCSVISVSASVELYRAAANAAVQEVEKILDIDVLNIYRDLLQMNATDEEIINDEVNKCEDDPTTKKICPDWKNVGACETQEDVMRKFCSKTCKFCTSCEDDPTTMDVCPEWKQLGACETQKDAMRMYCRKTCNYCEINNCDDDPTTKDVCPDWKNAGACETQKDVMRMYCRNTCNDCRALLSPVPDVPACAKTDYGCCWDNETIARGSTDDLKQSQCRPCLNIKSDVFCNRWQFACSSKLQGQGDVMKKECPMTCGVPCDYNMNINKCRDDPAHAKNCIGWYAEGKCTTEQDKMRVLCPSMCGFCNVNHV